MRYLLQSRADPTLLVGGDGATRSAGLRREYLTVLGRAARFSKRSDVSLARDGTVPAGFTLVDTAGALAFLQTDAATCAAADIGVILPSWWLGMDVKRLVSILARRNTAR